MTESEARQILTVSANVEVAKSDGGALEITISPRAQSGQTRLMLLMVLVGMIAAAIGAYGMYQFGFRTTPLKLIVLAAMGLIGLLIAVLVRIGSGPPRPQRIILSLGAIAVDHYLLGDHIVRRFTTAESCAISCEETQAFVSTRVGDTVLGQSLSKSAAIALAYLAAHFLWHGRQLNTEQRSIGYGITRTIIAPAPASP